MSKVIDSIDSELTDWIAEQRMFFVATAPSAADGHVNVSPKGGDSFRVLGPREVVYQDYTGSGAETVAHLRENGRVVVMFCAFQGPPRILRMHGRGSVIFNDDPKFNELVEQFPKNAGTRAFVHVMVDRISTSCGYSVPLMEFQAPRNGLDKWAETKGPDGLREYRKTKNVKSIDGLPAFD